MNREIKFRAWDTVAKMYFYVDSFHKNTKLSVLFDYVEISNGKNLPMILEQFTGLTDKNKEWIYEGSIIQIKHPYKNREFTGEIIFRSGRFYLNKFFMSQLDNPNDFIEALEYAEVIGNIHQNPELLK